MVLIDHKETQFNKMIFRTEYCPRVCFKTFINNDKAER